jgi:hypothetical protein
MQAALTHTSHILFDLVADPVRKSRTDTGLHRQKELTAHELSSAALSTCHSIAVAHASMLTCIIDATCRAAAQERAADRRAHAGAERAAGGRHIVT